MPKATTDNDKRLKIFINHNNNAPQLMCACQDGSFF